MTSGNSYSKRRAEWLGKSHKIMLPKANRVNQRLKEVFMKYRDIRGTFLVIFPWPLKALYWRGKK